MEPIRRRKLIDATIAAIDENGFSEATVSRISARAGVSTGVVHPYFGNKNDLLEATLRDPATTLRREAVERLILAPRPTSPARPLGPACARTPRSRCPPHPSPTTPHHTP